MRTVKFIAGLLLIFCLSGSAAALDLDELFGGDLFVEVEAEESKLPPEEALLVQDGWDVGGSYNFSVRASRTVIDGIEPVDSFGTSLGSQLYLDARPDPNFRVFGKVDLSYAVSKQTGSQDAQDKLDLRLNELFSDFNYRNQVFFRAGKQNVKWGVGYFYSPADVINVGRIDPLDPEAEREGPVALKVHYPKGSSNFYLYTLFDQVTSPTELALAPKAEFVVGKTEFGLGGFYQKDKAPRAMLTVSSSLGKLAVFGELVVSQGSDKGFVEGWPFDSYPIRYRDELFFQATAGARYSHSDVEGLYNFTAAGQYYYNGEGYEDQELIQNFRKYYGVLRLMDPEAAEKIALTDLSGTGKHYLAIMAGWNNVLGSKFSLSGFWNTNLSDRSGIVSATLRLPSLAKISPSVGVSWNYGEEGSEFGGSISSTTVFAAVTLGSGSF